MAYGTIGDMPPQRGVSHRLAARHTLWNVGGYLLPLAVAFVVLPPTVRHLGVERYGLLALVLVVHDYFGYFDFGLGRAATRLIAEVVHDPKRRASARSVFLTVLVFHVGLGIVIGVFFFIVVSIASDWLFSGSTAVVREGKATLVAAALFAPVLLALVAGRGTLEALQRFDLVNAVKVPSNALTYTIPLIGALGGLSLPQIVLLLVGMRLITGIVYVALAIRHLPEGSKVGVDWGLARPLLSFGGGIMAANLAGLFLVTGNRVFISALASVGALTYYSIPQDAVSRLWILPASVTSALFPMFAVAHGRDDGKASSLYADSTLYLLLLFVPVVVVIHAFGRELLGLWMGASFASEATFVLQVITVGVALDAVARIPLTFLQASGNPGIPARIRWLLVPLFLGTSAWAISRWGIAGAAVVWTGRVALETGMLFLVTERGGFLPLPRDARRRLQHGGLVALIVVVAAGVSEWLVAPGLVLELVLVLVILLAFTWYALKVLVDPGHRQKLGLLMSKARPS